MAVFLSEKESTLLREECTLINALAHNEQFKVNTKDFRDSIGVESVWLLDREWVDMQVNLITTS